MSAVPTSLTQTPSVDDICSSLFYITADILRYILYTLMHKAHRLLPFDALMQPKEQQTDKTVSRSASFTQNKHQYRIQDPLRQAVVYNGVFGAEPSFCYQGIRHEWPVCLSGHKAFKRTTCHALSCLSVI